MRYWIWVAAVASAIADMKMKHCLTRVGLKLREGFTPPTLLHRVMETGSQGPGFPGIHGNE